MNTKEIDITEPANWNLYVDDHDPLCAYVEYSIRKVETGELHGFVSYPITGNLENTWYGGKRCIDPETLMVRASMLSEGGKMIATINAFPKL